MGTLDEERGKNVWSGRVSVVEPQPTDMYRGYGAVVLFFPRADPIRGAKPIRKLLDDQGMALACAREIEKQMDGGLVPMDVVTAVIQI
jgi:hypothetical protein